MVSDRERLLTRAAGVMTTRHLVGIREYLRTELAYQDRLVGVVFCVMSADIPQLSSVRKRASAHGASITMKTVSRSNVTFQVSTSLENSLAFWTLERADLAQPVLLLPNDR